MMICLDERIISGLDGAVDRFLHFFFFYGQFLLTNLMINLLGFGFNFFFQFNVFSFWLGERINYVLGLELLFERNLFILLLVEKLILLFFLQVVNKIVAVRILLYSQMMVLRLQKVVFADALLLPLLLSLSP